MSICGVNKKVLFCFSLSRNQSVVRSSKHLQNGQPRGYLQRWRKKEGWVGAGRGRREAEAKARRRKAGWRPECAGAAIGRRQRPGAAQQKSVFRRPGGWRSRPRRQQDRFLRRPPRGVPIAVFNPRLHRAFPQYVSVCPNLLL